MKIILLILAAALVMAGTPARADDDTDFLQQLLSGDISEAGLKEFIRTHRGALEALLDEICGPSTKPARAVTDATETDATETESTTASSQASTAQVSDLKSSAPLKMGKLQLSGPLQTGKLEMSHLAGYPALPDVAPTSSIVNPTLLQLARKRELEKQQLDRKRFLMEHPLPNYR